MIGQNTIKEKENINMYIVYKGRVCVMVFDEQKNKYRFFRFRHWEKMTEEQKSKYRIDW